MAVLASIKTPIEKKLVYEFYQRVNEYQNQLDKQFEEFVQMIEKEYKELYIEIKETFDENNTVQQRAEHSIKLAKISGVEDNKIIKNHKQLDDFFLN